MFAIVVVPIYFPTNSGGGFPGCWLLEGSDVKTRGAVSGPDADVGKAFLLRLLLFFFFPSCFRAASEAHGGFHTRGQIGAVAAGLRHSHSNARSELRLQPTPQFTAMPDP